MGFQKKLPRIITYYDYKKFGNAKFRDDANNFAFDQFDVRNFKETIYDIFDKHAPIKQKYLRANEAPFMTKELHREIVKISRLRNNFLGTKSQEDRLKYNKQRNFCEKLLRTAEKLYFSNLDIKKQCLQFFLQNPRKVIKSSLMKTINMCLMTANYVRFFVTISPILSLNFKFQVYLKIFQARLI